jgi:hypothetical protein
MPVAFPSAKRLRKFSDSEAPTVKVIRKNRGPRQFRARPIEYHLPGVGGIGSRFDDFPRNTHPRVRARFRLFGRVPGLWLRWSRLSCDAEFLTLALWARVAGSDGDGFGKSQHAAATRAHPTADADFLFFFSLVVRDHVRGNTPRKAGFQERDLCAGRNFVLFGMADLGKQIEKLKKSSQRLRVGIKEMREEAEKLKAEYEAQEPRKSGFPASQKFTTESPKRP